MRFSRARRGVVNRVLWFHGASVALRARTPTRFEKNAPPRPRDELLPSTFSFTDISLSTTSTPKSGLISLAASATASPMRNGSTPFPAPEGPALSL